MTARRATVRVYVALTTLLVALLALLTGVVRVAVACVHALVRGVERIGRDHVGATSLPKATPAAASRSVADGMDRLAALEADSVRESGISAAAYALKKMGFRAADVKAWAKAIPADAPAKKVDEWVCDGLKALGS